MLSGEGQRRVMTTSAVRMTTKTRIPTMRNTTRLRSPHEEHNDDNDEDQEDDATGDDHGLLLSV
jgi:hypothetical protein